MKRLIYILVMLLPSLSWAQVQKEVEVTKAYAPSVSQAQKMAIIPNMTDTVKMRPDIDYSITSRSYQTSLMLENFRPATISYWDYTQRRPLYVKVAAGMPLASELDAYISTTNKDRGYAMAYVNHVGDYRNRKSLLGESVDDNTTEMSNRIGGRAGVFIGRKTLEADLYFDHQIRHRYPVAVADKIGFGKLQGKVRLGDDFVDMTRWNFNLEVAGGVFDHKSRAALASDEHFRHSNLDATFLLAKKLGHHLFRINLGYQGDFGSKAMSGYDNHRFGGGLLYGVSGKKLDFALGLSYFYNKIMHRPEQQSLLPYVRMSWRNSSETFVPYAELKRESVRDNSLSSLMYENPYFVPTAASLYEFAQLPYNYQLTAKFGIDGNIAKGVFSYTLSLSYINADQLMWLDYGGYYGLDYAKTWTVEPSPEFEYITIDNSEVLRFNGGFKLRPIHWFELEAMVDLRLKEINVDEGSLPEMKPKFRSDVVLRYVGRKIMADVTLDYASKMRWLQYNEAVGDTPAYNTILTTDAELQLGAKVEWQVSDRWGLYLEGRNLTGSEIHEWLHYYTSSPQAFVGVKMNF